MDMGPFFLRYSIVPQQTIRHILGWFYALIGLIIINIFPDKVSYIRLKEVLAN